MITKAACEKRSIPLGKFVIPNPFGPLEEERFTSYLIKTWMKGDVPQVRYPDYIRDNIHVSLLAKYYLYIVETVARDRKPFLKLSPTQNAEAQGEFASRFSKEISKRLDITCELENLENAEYSDPIKRINTDSLSSVIENWNEIEAWDQIADFYKKLYKDN